METMGGLKLSLEENCGTLEKIQAYSMDWLSMMRVRLPTNLIFCSL